MKKKQVFYKRQYYLKTCTVYQNINVIESWIETRYFLNSSTDYKGIN